jgi:hypothetical protein
MIRKEAILSSPLRLLDRSIHGGLGKGRLGVIVASPGVGKSACLAQIGLDALLRDRAVLHVAVGQPVEHVSARYDALFEDLADRVDLADRRGVRERIAHRRLIWALTCGALDAHGLDEALAAFQAHLGVAPHAVLVDGYELEGPGRAGALAALKACAARAGAELWMTARGAAPGPLHRDDPWAALAEIGILLEPHGRHARLTLVKDHDLWPGEDVHLVLEGGALVVPPGADPLALERRPGAHTLLATASAGAEAEFGACAERWGLSEVNFTFEGRREEARSRGLVRLSEEELAVGAVSPAYLRAHLHRSFGDSPELRRVLQAIWHQVSAAGELFAVGTLDLDGTAHGGTGWAVELARHWAKPVHLFDQDRGRWVRWSGAAWEPAAPPAITRERFAGAGTRSPTDAGRAAIQGLFERSFGAAP